MGISSLVCLPREISVFPRAWPYVGRNGEPGSESSPPSSELSGISYGSWLFWDWVGRSCKGECCWDPETRISSSLSASLSGTSVTPPVSGAWPGGRSNDCGCGYGGGDGGTI